MHRSLDDNTWFKVSLYVTNWSDFTQTCKLFYSFNTPEMCLLKYDKARSFLKRYPKLLDLIREEEAHSPFEWSKVIPKWLGNTHNTPINTHYLNRSYRYHLAHSPFKVAHQIVESTFYNRSLDSTESLYLKECYDILGSRQDLDTKKARLIPPSSSEYRHFLRVATSNPALSLLNIRSLRKTNCLWVKSKGLSERPNLTFSDIKEYPEMYWDYPALLLRLRLEDQEVEYLLDKVVCECGVKAPLHLNPYITWDQTIRYLDDKRIRVDSWLLAGCVTFEKVLSLKERALMCKVYYLAILLNPTLTFEQTDKLIELKGGI